MCLIMKELSFGCRSSRANKREEINHYKVCRRKAQLGFLGKAWKEVGSVDGMPPRCRVHTRVCIFSSSVSHAKFRIQIPKSPQLLLWSFSCCVEVCRPTDRDRHWQADRTVDENSLLSVSFKLAPSSSSSSPTDIT